MFYTIYKITNTINGKIYIGCHKTSNLDDDYMGSGKVLKQSQDKYGIENFEKEILEIFDNPEQMFEMEAKLVNSEFVERTDTYNLKEGGSGGFEYINSNVDLRIAKNKKAREIANANGANEKAAEAIKWLIENDPIWLKKRSEKHSQSLIKYYESHSSPFKGKKHSKEFKEKISKINSEKQKGEGNSQFGTMWIHSLTEKVSKKINKDEFSDWEAKGWLKGRKMKFL